MGILLYITFIVISLFILYLVIETAVRNGINNSKVGKLIDKQYGAPYKKSSFLDHDLDDE